MKILLIEKNDSYRQQLVLMLENIFPECALTLSIGTAQAREVLQNPKSGQFDLVILGLQENVKESIRFINEDIYRHVSLIFSDEKNLAELSLVKSKERMVVTPPMKMNVFADQLKALVPARNFLQKAGREILDDQYGRVRLSFFWRFNRTDADIYLRLSRHKFIKIIHAGDFYDKDLLEKYAKKKQEYLYITKVDFERFGSRLGSTPFLGLIDDSTHTSPERMVRQTHALLQDLVMSVGVSESAVKMANMYCDFVVNTTVKKSNKGLLDLFKNMRERKDYLYDHSYLLSCLCAYISKELQWHTSDTIEKLCYAALFHDITIKDPELAMMTDLGSAQVAGFTPEELLSYHQHPLVAAKMIKDSGSFPTGVEGIIVQHHETPEGKGFPKGVSPAQLSPLVCVFILAHDFISELYKAGFDLEAAKATVHSMQSRYQHGNFVKVFDAFKKVVHTALGSLAKESVTA